MANVNLGVSGTNIDPWNTDAVYGDSSISNGSTLPEKSMQPVRHIRTAPDSGVSLSNIGSTNLSFGGKNALFARVLLIFALEILKN